MLNLVPLAGEQVSDLEIKPLNLNLNLDPNWEERSRAGHDTPGMFKTGQNTLNGGAPLIQDLLAHFHDLWVFSLRISQGGPGGPFWPSLGSWVIFQNCHTHIV